MADDVIVFESGKTTAVPKRIGKATVAATPSAKILSPARGFMGDYDFTLNPYSGCQFGCNYCYAAFFASSTQRSENWGLWVDVKINAVREIVRHRSLAGKKVYMGSVTDPYQPLEQRVELTRAILESLAAPGRQPRLVIQTRSPLVTRDIDILRGFDCLRVNVTVTTDSDAIRKRFEPYCPGNERRLEALATLKDAGIRIGVCVTPMLPLEDAERFARRLAALRADVYVAQPFKPSRGPFAASTRRMALDIAEEYDWTPRRYAEALAVLRRHLPDLHEGREGFMPPE